MNSIKTSICIVLLFLSTVHISYAGSRQGIVDAAKRFIIDLHTLTNPIGFSLQVYDMNEDIKIEQSGDYIVHQQFQNSMQQRIPKKIKVYRTANEITMELLELILTQGIDPKTIATITEILNDLDYERKSEVILSLISLIQKQAEKAGAAAALLKMVPTLLDKGVREYYIHILVSYATNGNNIALDVALSFIGAMNRQEDRIAVYKRILDDDKARNANFIDNLLGLLKTDDRGTTDKQIIEFLVQILIRPDNDSIRSNLVDQLLALAEDNLEAEQVLVRFLLRSKIDKVRDELFKKLLGLLGNSIGGEAILRKFLIKTKDIELQKIIIMNLLDLTKSNDMASDILLDFLLKTKSVEMRNYLTMELFAKMNTDTNAVDTLFSFLADTKDTNLRDDVLGMLLGLLEINNGAMRIIVNFLLETKELNVRDSLLNKLLGLAKPGNNASTGLAMFLLLSEDTEFQRNFFIKHYNMLVVTLSEMARTGNAAAQQLLSEYQPQETL